MKGKFLTIPFLLVLILLLPALGSTGSAQSSSLTNTIRSNIQGATANFDSQKAIGLAEASQGFQHESANHSLAFNSIFDTWNFDSSGSVTWITVNVVFSFSSSDGTTKNLVITEDPALTSVREVNVQNSTYHGGTSYSTNWSGYTFTGNSGATNPVYEAYAYWSVPTVSEPQAYFCFFAHCDLSLWAGLTATSGGSTGIVQAGTDSGLYCTVGCSYYYYGWYEFYPAGSVTCSNSFSPNNVASADIYNHAENGGSSTVYDIYVYNLTTGTACSVTNHSFTNFNTPYYGQFIGERPSFGGSPARLPKFGSVTMTGDIFYPVNHYVGIYTPYSNGWYTKIIMQNSGNTNIQVGSVSSSSGFTQTWLTSSGT